MTVEPIQFPQRRTADLAGLSAIVDALREEMQGEIAKAVRAYVTVPPTPITVHPQVSAPSVTFQGAPCEHDTEVNVTIPGMEQMAARLASIDTNLQKLLGVLSRPVTRTIERDSGGRIESMRESR